MAYAIGYLLVVAVIAAALGWRRPAWSKRKIIVAAALPGPMIFLVAGICMAIIVVRQPGAPGEIDASGMAMAAILMVSAMVALGALIGGLLVATLSVSLLKASGDRPTS